MPVRESEALILRSFPLGEADRLVSFLSRSEGRMRGVASGARRTKSRFGSTLQLFSYVRIWFYERETRDLVRINQCELIESFLEAQRDYAVSLALALVSEVTEAVLGEHEVAEPNFRCCSWWRDRSRRARSFRWFWPTSRFGRCAWAAGCRRSIAVHVAARL